MKIFLRTPKENNNNNNNNNNNLADMDLSHLLTDSGILTWFLLPLGL